MKRRMAKRESGRGAPDGKDDADGRIAAMRTRSSFLRFYLVCGQADCRRARECRGDPEACFTRCWPRVPEEIKVWWRTLITSRARGSSVKQAMAFAESERRRYCTLNAQRGADAPPLTHGEMPPLARPGIGAV